MGKTVNSLALKADNYSLSERTKELRDQEQRELADHAYDRAKQMLAERSDLLEKLAMVLLEKETLDQHEVEEILGVEHPKPGPVNQDRETVAAFDASPEDDPGGGATDRD
jgi:cell division protease FtsH